MSPTTTPVIIVGGGISGLATAWFLQRRGVAATVLEAEREAGGTVRTTESDGFVVDTGPTSMLHRGGALGEWITALGLDADLVAADARAPRYVVKNHTLVPLPSGPSSFVGTPLFSRSAKWRLLAEPFRGRAREEESIAQFVRRRLGSEFLDWAVDPFVAGIYAGDPERLSVRAALPRLYALEAEYGSLFAGALARALRGRAGGAMPRGRLVAFRRGMQTLPLAAARALGDAVRLAWPVTAIERNRAGEWIARGAAGEYRSTHLVLAVPAYRAAELLGPLDATLAQALAAIAYPPVASIALGFAREQIGHRLDGFGALLPHRLQREALGVVFSSSLFPGRAPPGKVLLTAFIGGARNTRIREFPPAALAERVLAELRPLLDIHGSPIFQHATLWPRAIPQYELGHDARLAAIDAALARLPGLDLRANWRDGVSLADSVAAADRLAALVARAAHPRN